MDNTVIVNAADFKFSDFSEQLSLIGEEYHNEDWYIMLREIDAKINNESIQDKVTFSDDRCVLIAYKIMAETNAFSDAKLREWWIVKRYLDIYADAKTPGIETLREFVTLYIGATFSGAIISDDEENDLISAVEVLRNVIFEENYLKLPEFVIHIIEAQSDRSSKFVNPSKTKEAVKEFDFEGDEKSQWEGLLATSKIMLEDKNELTEEEIKQWEGALSTAELMLE